MALGTPLVRVLIVSTPYSANRTPLIALFDLHYSILYDSHDFDVPGVISALDPIAKSRLSDCFQGEAACDQDGK